MVVDTRSGVLSQADTAKLLIISGVNISNRARTPDPERPVPDYVALVNSLHSDTLDIDDVDTMKNPVISFARKRLGHQWALAFAVLFRARQYQAVVATGEDVGLPLAFLLKLFRVRLPLIISCHNITTRRPAFFLGKLKVGTAVRRFLCLSTTQVRVLTDQYGISEDRVDVLYYPVDHQYFQPMPDVPVQRQLCSAGMANRDYATLIEAVRGLDVHVKIDANSAWHQQALNVGDGQLPENVEMRRGATTSALRQLYAESMFVVVPLIDIPFASGFSVILEAMAMGKAVIVTRTQQPGDFIRDGWNGFNVTPGNAAELRNRIQFLLDHPDEARRMGENARASVEEQFTLQHHVRRIQMAAQHVLARS